jgi:hypothetical protein
MLYLLSSNTAVASDLSSFTPAKTQKLNSLGITTLRTLLHARAQERTLNLLQSIASALFAKTPGVYPLESPKS